jgi:hypothetical protein
MNVKFNVGGKIYFTSLATIELMKIFTGGTDLLNMLVKNNKNGEIFIDRDHKLFRWILNAYRTSVLVDYKTANVPQEVWEMELDFYGIKEVFLKKEQKQKEERKAKESRKQEEERRKAEEEHIRNIEAHRIREEESRRIRELREKWGTWETKEWGF